MNLGYIKLPADAVKAREVEKGWKLLKTEVILKNGDTAMEGHVNVNYHRIVNLDIQVHSNDAANITYVDRLIP